MNSGRVFGVLMDDFGVWRSEILGLKPGPFVVNFCRFKNELWSSTGEPRC